MALWSFKKRATSNLDVRHLHLEVVLAVADLAAVVLAALELEDRDLVALLVADHVGRDLRAVHVGGADLRLIAPDQQDAVEHDRVRLLIALAQIDLDDVALADPDLRAAV